MELVNREDNYTCHHPERITRHKRKTMYENEQLPLLLVELTIEFLKELCVLMLGSMRLGIPS
jgi:hypothetical protein